MYSPPPESEKNEISPMSSRVDPAAWVVEVDGRRWPFEIELATGAAQVRFDGRTAMVQPLTWREKITLARYAETGPEFIDGALLGHRLGSADAADGSSASEHRALVELARWLNGFAPSNAESLDPAQLGQIARRALQSGGLTMADLDLLPAFEVELLARSAGTPVAGEQHRPAEESTTRHPSGDDQVTRILVVPDPEPQTENPKRPATDSESTAADPQPTGGSTLSTAGSPADANPPHPRSGSRVRPGLMRAAASTAEDLPFLAAAPVKPDADGDQDTPPNPVSDRTRSKPLLASDRRTAEAASVRTRSHPSLDSPQPPATRSAATGANQAAPAAEGTSDIAAAAALHRLGGTKTPAPHTPARHTPARHNLIARGPADRTRAAGPAVPAPITARQSRNEADEAAGFPPAPPAGPHPPAAGSSTAVLPARPGPLRSAPELGAPALVAAVPPPVIGGNRDVAAQTSAAQPSATVGALLTELARQLEQATSDLGLDPED